METLVLVNTLDNLEKMFVGVCVLTNTLGNLEKMFVGVSFSIFPRSFFPPRGVCPCKIVKGLLNPQVA